MLSGFLKVYVLDAHSLEHVILLPATVRLPHLDSHGEVCVVVILLLLLEKLLKVQSRCMVSYKALWRCIYLLLHSLIKEIAISLSLLKLILLTFLVFNCLQRLRISLLFHSYEVSLVEGWPTYVQNQFRILWE